MAQCSDPRRLRPPLRMEKQVGLQPVIGDLVVGADGLEPPTLSV
jgi:hypothetical protein